MRMLFSSKIMIDKSFKIDHEYFLFSIIRMKTGLRLPRNANEVMMQYCLVSECCSQSQSVVARVSGMLLSPRLAQVVVGGPWLMQKVLPCSRLVWLPQTQYMMYTSHISS